MTCHQSCTSIGTGKCTGNFSLYCIRTCHGNSQPSCTRIGAGFMVFPVPVLLQESVQEIVPYTIPGYAMEILNHPAQGLVQDLWSFLYQYCYRKVYRKLCPILYQDMSWKFSTVLISTGAKHV